jgi:AcrR family transcriptional regulator
VPTRRRLSPAERRSHLIAVAAENFSQTLYDDVRMDDVARRAGVSRALLYHYFPAKRELFMAVLEYTGELMRQSTRTDPELEPLDRLRAGLTHYFDFAAGNAPYFLAVHRIGSADGEIEGVIRGWKSLQEERIHQSLPEQWRTPRTRLVVRVWTSYVVSLCQEWLDDTEATPQEELVEMCVHVFVATLSRAVGAHT